MIYYLMEKKNGIVETFYYTTSYTHSIEFKKGIQTLKKFDTEIKNKKYFLLTTMETRIELTHTHSKHYIQYIYIKIL